MSTDALVGLIATVFVGVAGIVVAIWVELRRNRKATNEAGAGAVPATQDAQQVVSRLDRIHEARVIRCGVINHPPLSSWQRGEDTTAFSGYYVELAREVGKQAKLSVEFVAMDWGVLSTAFTDLKVDIVLSIFETRARQQYAEFVACLHKVGVSGVMRPKAKPLREVSELSDPDLRIAVAIGEVGWEYVTQELGLPRAQLVQVGSGALRTAFSPLLSGDADIAIVDDLTCAEFVKANPGYQHVFAKDSLYVCKNSIMVPRGEADFARWVDEAFLAARREPRLFHWRPRY